MLRRLLQRGNLGRGPGEAAGDYGGVQNMFTAVQRRPRAASSRLREAPFPCSQNCLDLHQCNPIYAASSDPNRPGRAPRRGRTSLYCISNAFSLAVVAVFTEKLNIPFG